MAILAPSLLAADYSRLGEMVGAAEAAGAQWLHLDVMDGHFVPNISFGPGLVADLRRVSGLFFDAHLMISDPMAYIDAFAKAGADLICFHLEAVGDPAPVLEKIHGLGLKAGISIKPGTDWRRLEPYLARLDLVLVMSVEPGFGGQSFMEPMLAKVRGLKRQKEAGGHSYHIQIDGGINRETARQAVAAGAEVLVAGTAIFGAADIAGEVRYFTDL